MAAVGAAGGREDRAAGAEAQRQVGRAQAASGAGTATCRPPATPSTAGPAPRVVRATRYAVKPMSVEDAALRVDGDRETFVVFRNADTDAVSILYRRKDGNLGLIEPD